METFKATRISIIAERLIEKKITDLLETAGATGYSIYEGGGQGEGAFHPAHGPSIIDGMGIVKIEVILSDRSVAETIAQRVMTEYLKDHSGVIYLHEVEVLRPEKF